MNDTATTRRWTAAIAIERHRDGQHELRVIEADVPQDSDTQDATARAAIRQAIPYTSDGFDAMIRLFKTTKAHGTVQDQLWYMAAGERSARR